MCIFRRLIRCLIPRKEGQHRGTRGKHKVLVFGVDWGTVLAVPRPIYDPGCQPLYEGLIPNSCTAKAASLAANVAKPAAQSAPTASVAAPTEAPTATSHFQNAMGAVQAAGTNATFEVCCLFVLLNFQVDSINFSRTLNF